MHACVCAYSINVPFVGFVWDEKLESFANVTNLENQFLFEKELDGQIAVKKIFDSFDLIYDNEKKNVLKEKARLAINDFIDIVRCNSKV